MHLHGTVSELARQDDDLRNDQLGNASRIREGRVEDGDTLLRGILEVHLVRADTKAANNQQVLRLLENLFSELRLGADSNDVDIPVIPFSTPPTLARPEVLEFPTVEHRCFYLPDLLDELIFGQRGLQGLNLVTLAGEDILASLVDIFEQEDLDALGVEGGQVLRRPLVEVDTQGPGRRRLEAS